MTRLYICTVSTTGKDSPDTLYIYIPVGDNAEENKLYSTTVSHLQGDGSWHHSGAPSPAIMASFMGQGPAWTEIDLADVPPVIRKRLPSLKLNHKNVWFRTDVDLNAQPAPKPRRPPLNWRRILFIAVLTAILLALLNHYFPRQ